MADKINVHDFRKPDHSIDPQFIERWSPRALSGEEISDAELNSLFEAARWAPSAFNDQPWHFIYAKRNTEHWDRLYNIMVEFNQTWAKNASVLIVIVSRTQFAHNGKPSRTHSFDTGAAWAILTLQASKMGLITHGMSGIDYEKAAADLNIPDEYAVEAMAAVGKPGNVDDLPEALAEREKPSGRNSIKEFAFEGIFKK